MRMTIAEWFVYTLPLSQRTAHMNMNGTHTQTNTLLYVTSALHNIENRVEWVAGAQTRKSTRTNRMNITFSIRSTLNTQWENLRCLHDNLST